jgi:hypothetical protein
MRKLSIFLIWAGIFWIVYAFNMDTSVITGGETYGSGEFAVQVPIMRVNNLGLMNEKQNNLIISSLILIIGIVLFLVAQKNQKQDNNLKQKENTEIKQRTNRIEDFISIYIEHESAFQSDNYLKKLYVRASEQDPQLKLTDLDDGIAYAIKHLDKATPEANDRNDVFETIAKLSSLNKSGAISDDEFLTKKSELLSKI